MKAALIPISKNQALTAEGFLICRACPVARVGGLNYAASDLPRLEPRNGEVTVFRDAAALFDDGCIASFEGKPVTLEHPKGLEDVTPDNAADLVVGHMGNVRRGEGEYSDCLVADLTIQRRDAIDAVMSGECTQLSLGYTSTLYSVGAGLAREEQIRGNHVALVPQGRCGTVCSIRDFSTTGGTNTMAENGCASDEKKRDEEDGTDLAVMVKALSEQINALTERVAGLEKGAAGESSKQDEDITEDKPKEDEEKKRDAAKRDSVPPVSLDELVSRKVAKALAEQSAQAKATEAVIRDAATVAPQLPRDTPDLAYSALEAMAKTEEGAALLKHLGGLSAIKRDDASTALRTAAILKRAFDAERMGSRAEPQQSQQAKSFFEQAAEMWEK